MRTPIAVSTPRFWWRTMVDDARRWVPADPDTEDGRQRHADRDLQRWAVVAAVVAQVGDALAAGDWTTDPESDDRGLVNLEEYPENLTRTEQRIVAAWFSASEAVRFDPWFEPLTNGRHRLWATFPHFGSALIPVCSDALGYANPADAEALGASWPQWYAQNLDELDMFNWFAANDPLNVQFRGSVATAASGQFPPSTAPPR